MYNITNNRTKSELNMKLKYGNEHTDFELIDLKYLKQHDHHRGDFRSDVTQYIVARLMSITSVKV